MMLLRKSGGAPHPRSNSSTHLRRWCYSQTEEKLYLICKSNGTCRGLGERGHRGSIFLRGTQLPRCPLSTVTIFLVSCSTAKGAQCFPAGRFVPVLALACMGKAADMGRSSASTSEIFLEGGRSLSQISWHF